jgi:hypothetical protein
MNRIRVVLPPDDAMNPRRYPRTINEAFGPYVDDNLHEMWVQRSWLLSDVAVICIGLIVIIGLFAGLFQ